MVPMARGGLAPDTIKGHRRSLRWIHDCMPIGQFNAPAHLALLELVNKERRLKNWMWSTTVTKMATIQGAFSLLPLHGHVNFEGMKWERPILLNEPAWTMALRAATRRAREQLGRQPKAALAQHVRQLLSSPLIPVEMKALVLLAWLTASRVGDALK